MDKIHHIAIEAKNIAASVEYYTQNFACEISYQDATWALLKFANISVALVTPGQHPPHLGFVKENAHEWGELKTHRDGTESVYIEDVSGNALEILSPKNIVW